MTPKNIEYFLSDGDDEGEKVDKFTMFNEWCRAEGVIMSKVEYPAYFEGGLLGIKCTQDVACHEAFLYIPFKMIMSIEKAKKHDVLAEIIAENPDCFDQQ